MPAVFTSHNYRLALLIALLLIGATFSPLFAAIKNGYQQDLHIWNLQVKGLENALAKETHNDAQRRTLISILRHTKRYRDELKKSHDRTAQILEQFKQIDDELFQVIDNIKDKQGNVTDVYVKLVNNYGEENGIFGTTSLNQCPRDQHVYISSYGRKSVEVIVNAGPKAMMLLAHEFGHVRYQVPNLASYVRYFQRHYDHPNQLNTGHLTDDPSHLSVVYTLRKFKYHFLRQRRNLTAATF